MKSAIKYALVHEWLTPKAKGGSELVVKEILKHIKADIYALIDFESNNPESYLYGRTIGHTFLQNFPFARNGVQKYLPLLPLAMEQLDLREYDVILSSSHAVAKGVLSSPQQLHICYCHTPMRYAWDLTFDYLNHSQAGKGIPGIFTRYLLHRLRQWDVISANRVDYFIANSHHTARRIWRCYRREAKVIYPPVNVERFPFSSEKQDFYLTVSRLVSYKKIALIVRAFNQLGYPLVIIGDGPDLAKIRQMAQGNIKVMGAQNNQVVEQYMTQAKAFVYAACEDFGIALVEAQACGTPVIAYGGGGALETVIDIRQDQDQGTGIFFFPQTHQALAETVETFSRFQHQIRPESCRNQAAKFTPKVFETSYLAFLEQCYQDFTKTVR
ncbi:MULTISPECIES: glycosyltransferase [Crocosphaera]|uniref:Glycosyltransferase n=3 Tax=Crocosphaera watsonii TaxID=263511 RepID=T2JUT0_CROWT|nr:MULTISPECIES: glycosyltransferase [Crocosphaera]EHJ14933.1 Glycosyl transferase, group 1 [Crocosphaera watsonii WH 0003]MCH2244066.1 glycosyltransferase [Crocosphaera sp.]NQZ63649.1 glycosyltransferase [Crocosphaera sp.]CCQ58944.1 Glycosyl transferase, group 1 [Crocosphaera watsonii WH 0005]CCQ68367.1 Glycosyltransferase [Crocosphaera watsonii WH 0402]